ncbi:MAG TPA: hypothetical protein VMT16_07635, partial [Thermoanaerobaculia bacterium]|nr:hypothetical protein [Thermoanaerobaculia bacterium]
MDPRLRDLLAINRAIAETLDYERVLELVVEKTAELTAAEECALLLRDDAGMARVVASRGIEHDRAQGFSAPLDERIHSALRELLSYEEASSFLARTMHEGARRGPQGRVRLTVRPLVRAWDADSTRELSSRRSARVWA